MSNENVADGDVRRKGGLGQRIAYACGNLGQAAFYNAMSTYFVTYVTSCLFVSYSKALAAQMIAVITGLISRYPHRPSLHRSAAGQPRG